ncbi:MAG: metal-dependent transcriptional regulator [Chloroflexota bacterium]|nr:metal-dependent transcriptional regulator [Chloroflexota bacterium]
MVSASAEDYLKTIYKLEEEEQPVALSTLAGELAISSVSANEMVRKLAKQGLVIYEPYKGVALTPKGRAQALTVTRRHRLWERFLTDVLGLGWNQVHEEACRLEHATSLRVAERLAQLLGQPETCPHGYPVPTAGGEIVLEAGHTLSELEPGQKGVVLHVPEEPELLQYLGDLGLKPQAVVRVEAVAPFQGPLTVRVGGARHTLGRRVASKIMVRLL